MHISILVSSAGRRVELIQCLRQSAQEMGIKLTVFASDISPEWSSACRVADHRFSVPRCLDDAFIPEMVRLVSEHRIRLIIPTIDTELRAFSSNLGKFSQIGCKVSVGAITAVTIARSKLLTAQTLRNNNIPTPVTLSWELFCGNIDALPLPAILKPNDGSCSSGIVLVDDWSTFNRGRKLDGYIIQERLIGEEFTVNCYTNGHGQLVAAIPHLRRETRGGEVSKAEVVHHSALEDAAVKINKAVPGLYGAWCFQAISAGEKIGIFEINARFGGGYPIAHRAGGHFTRLLLEDALGIPNSAMAAWKPGVCMMRYDAAIFSDSP